MLRTCDSGMKLSHEERCAPVLQISPIRPVPDAHCPTSDAHLERIHATSPLPFVVMARPERLRV